MNSKDDTSMNDTEEKDIKVSNVASTAKTEVADTEENYKRNDSNER
jgi:hypothetical protein